MRFPYMTCVFTLVIVVLHLIASYQPSLINYLSLDPSRLVELWRVCSFHLLNETPKNILDSLIDLVLYGVYIECWNLVLTRSQFIFLFLFASIPIGLLSVGLALGFSQVKNLSYLATQMTSGTTHINLTLITFFAFDLEWKFLFRCFSRIFAGFPITYRSDYWFVINFFLYYYIALGSIATDTEHSSWVTRVASILVGLLLCIPKVKEYMLQKPASFLFGSLDPSSLEERAYMAIVRAQYVPNREQDGERLDGSPDVPVALSDPSMMPTHRSDTETPSAAEKASRKPEGFKAFSGKFYRLGGD